MATPAYPLLLALPNGRIQHAAKQSTGGYVHTLCGRAGIPTGDGAGLPFCARCRARPNPISQQGSTALDAAPEGN